MDSFSTFIDMGGYAAFVWPSYALAVLGLVGIFMLSRRAVKTRQAELNRLRPPSGGATSRDDNFDEKAIASPAKISPDNVSLEKGTRSGET